MSLPTKEQIEEYFTSLEDHLSSSLSAVTPDPASISDALQRLWLDVSRFGPPQMPTLPDLRIPGLGNFQVPPPPPPPPPTPVSTSWIADASEWASRNRWVVSGICASAVGAGLLVGYGATAFTRGHGRTRGVKQSSASTRRQVVVVLGGDTPLGFPLVSALEMDGFIVIASVSNPEAVEELERRCNGYVRALVFDPREPATMSYFLRSLQATMSLRFPINVPGDPYHASPASGTYIHSLISLITLPTPSMAPAPMPLEHLPLTSTYLPYLMQTHISPLQTIQAILPLFRVSHARARDVNSRDGRRRSIVICVPATDARVGVPFASAKAMSAAATVRGAEVLRREIQAASVSGAGYETMKDLQVMIVDVGSLGSSPSVLEQHSVEDMEKSVAEWTSSERSVYGGAFSYVLQQIRGQTPRRKPAPVGAFVDAVVSAVGGNGTRGRQIGVFAFGLKLWSTNLRNWIRGERFAVGAGAHTYTFASYLPRVVLDALLNLPALLVSMRNALLPMPSRSPAAVPPLAPHGPNRGAKSDVSSAEDQNNESPSSASDAEREESGASSEADVESNTGEVPGVEGSWVSLQGQETN